jgi:D-glycero-D-manno-heptose 1,7-bisphosphate phosphatase
LSGRQAAFLDRDGTLIDDANYLSDPEKVVLLPGTAAAIRRLNERGILVIVVTNQSGIAQGLHSEEQYRATRTRLDELLAAEGARIDATYHCPHHPDVTGPCECRKPGTLLYRRAAQDFGIDLAASFYAGDRYRDIAPGLQFGGLVRLIPSPNTPDNDVRDARKADLVAGSLNESLDAFLGGE